MIGPFSNGFISIGASLIRNNNRQIICIKEKNLSRVDYLKTNEKMKMNMENIVAPNESPIILEKLLTTTKKSDGKEPNLLASPNAFDWEKRLALPGGSPNAFALSLNCSEMPTTNQLFDYPSQQPIDNHQNIEYVSEFQHLAPLGEEYSESPVSMAAAGNGVKLNKLLNPLPPKRVNHDRRDSHRESERRRREAFKNAMFHLENLVILTLNRAGSCKILGKGPKRKLAHSEIYRMARDIIVTLKEEIVRIEHMNQELSYSLQN